MDDEQRTENDAAIEAGEAAAQIDDRVTERNGIPIGLESERGKIRVLSDVLAAADERAEAPRRRKGSATHQELDSFIAHVNRFKDAGSVVWADAQNTKLTAVLNYHPAGEAAPRWNDHRSIYACPLSRQWLLWIGRNEKPMGQEEFGQFVEDNMADLANPGAEPEDADLPPPAKVLEVARTLIVRTKGEFSRTLNPTSGEFSLVNKLENESTSTKIPRAFLLQLPVFEAGTPYRVEARLRFSMADGKPRFAFALYQIDVIKRDAFGEVRQQVVEGTGLPVFVGTPEG